MTNIDKTKFGLHKMSRQDNSKLTKEQMSTKLSNSLGFTKKDAKKIVNAFFESIRNSLISGENVKISGFGNFELKDKKERLGRNPATREEFLIPSQRVVLFKIGNKAKKMIQNTQKQSHIKQTENHNS